MGFMGRCVHVYLFATCVVCVCVVCTFPGCGVYVCVCISAWFGQTTHFVLNATLSVVGHILAPVPCKCSHKQHLSEESHTVIFFIGLLQECFEFLQLFLLPQASWAVPVSSAGVMTGDR